MMTPKRSVTETNAQSIPRDGVPFPASVTLPKIAFLDPKNFLPFERPAQYGIEVRET